MIEINNLCFSYGSRQILNQVNLSVRQAAVSYTHLRAHET